MANCMSTVMITPASIININKNILQKFEGMPDKLDKTFIATSAVSGVATVSSVALTGMGFTSSGIAAASTAAGMQAGIGNVVAGSLFATVQSLGATGFIATVGTTGVIGLGVGAAYLAFKFWSQSKPKL